MTRANGHDWWRSPIRPDRELAACGCRLSARAFKQVLAAAFLERADGRTIEQLVMDSEEAIRFGDGVRRRARCDSLPSWLINSMLQNLRKDGTMGPLQGRRRRPPVRGGHDA